MRVETGYGLHLKGLESSTGLQIFGTGVGFGLLASYIPVSSGPDSTTDFNSLNTATESGLISAHVGCYPAGTPSIGVASG